jgi:hypothetical protein
MHANAADVGGNNVSINGTTYNTDGVTVAEVLGTQATETTPATAPPASSPTTTPVAAANGSATASSGAHDFNVHHHVDHFGHMWA